MSKDVIIIVLGVVVAAISFLGFPSLWESIILAITGVAIAVLAFLSRQDVFRRGVYQSRHEEQGVYVENGSRIKTTAPDERKGTAHAEAGE